MGWLNGTAFFKNAHKVESSFCGKWIIWAMNALVAINTKCDQIAFCIVSQGTATFDVVDLEILQRTTTLAAPAIAL